MDPQSVAPEEGGGSRGSPPQPAVVQGTIVEADELRKLADLKQQGLLTDEEFSTAKAKLLARMSMPTQVVAPPKVPFLHGTHWPGENGVPRGVPKRSVVSIYSSAQSQYLTNDHFGQSRSPVPWTIEIVKWYCDNGRHTVRLQGGNGLYLRSDGHEGSPPAWTTEPDRTTEWHLLFHARSAGPEGRGEWLRKDETLPVQLKSPSNGGSEMYLCNDLPTGGWGGSVKGKYSWCPEGRGDAFWHLSAWREEDGDAHFLPCAAFAGSRPGFTFLNGAKGLGYYRETWPGAAAMERGDLISPGDLPGTAVSLDAAGKPFCAGQSCWCGIVLCLPWCGTLRAVDADTCFPRRPLVARRGDPRLARYARDFHCCWGLPVCGAVDDSCSYCELHEYRRSPGSNRFLLTSQSVPPGQLAEFHVDWEYFTSKDVSYSGAAGDVCFRHWKFRVC
jgi:hypothetical protein